MKNLDVNWEGYVNDCWVQASYYIDRGWVVLDWFKAYDETDRQVYSVSEEVLLEIIQEEMDQVA